MNKKGGGEEGVNTSNVGFVNNYWYRSDLSGEISIFWEIRKLERDEDL